MTNSVLPALSAHIGEAHHKGETDEQLMARLRAKYAAVECSGESLVVVDHSGMKTTVTKLSDGGAWDYSCFSSWSMGVLDDDR